MTKIKNESVSNLKKTCINADFPNGLCSIPRPLHPFFSCKSIHVFFQEDTSVAAISCFSAE